MSDNRIDELARHLAGGQLSRRQVLSAVAGAVALGWRATPSGASEKCPNDCTFTSSAGTRECGCPRGQVCGSNGQCQSSACATIMCGSVCCPDPSQGGTKPFIATCNSCPDNGHNGAPTCDTACKFTTVFGTPDQCCEACHSIDGPGCSSPSNCPGSAESCDGATCVQAGQGGVVCG